MVAVQQEIGSKARIVTAARHLFTVRGFHQTAMSELATEAEVSVGQIYRLFKGKADIILAIVDEDIGERVTDIGHIAERAKAGEITAEAALCHLAIMAMTDKDEALGLEIMAEGYRNPEVAGAIASLCSGYRLALRSIVEVAHPHLPTKDIDAGEELLLACMFGLNHRSMSGPKLSIEDAAKITATMLTAALVSLG